MRLLLITTIIVILFYAAISMVNFNKDEIVVANKLLNDKNLNSTEPQQVVNRNMHNSHNIRSQLLRNVKKDITNGNYIKEYIDRFIRERPYNENTFIELGTILYLHEYKDWAKEIIERALWENPVNIEALQVLAMIYEDSEELERYIEFYNKTLSRFPKNIELYDNFAHFYINHSEIDQAINVLLNGVGNNPDNPNFKYLLGDYLDLQGRQEEALEQYKLVLEVKDDDPSAYFFMGNIYLKMGQEDLANSLFDVAAQLSDEFAQEVEYIHWQTGNLNNTGGGDGYM